MERFVRRQNVEHYMQLLTTITEGAQRQKIMKLLSEECQKQKDAGDRNARISYADTAENPLKEQIGWPRRYANE